MTADGKLELSTSMRRLGVSINVAASILPINGRTMVSCVSRLPSRMRPRTTLSFFATYQISRSPGGISRETNLLGVYAYQISIGQNQFGVGAAVAIVMVLITLVLTMFYLRSMTRTEEL